LTSVSRSDIVVFVRDNNNNYRQGIGTGARMTYTPRMGIVKKSGWAKGLIVREINESYSFTGLDDKGITIVTIMTENIAMTGGIVAVRDSEVTWGK